MGRLFKTLRWIVVTAAMAGLILGLAVAAGGLWLALREPGDFETGRQDRIRSLSGERFKVRAALGAVHERLAKIPADIASGQERIKQAERVIVQLKGLDNTWDKLTGDAQQRANTERREKLEKQQAETKAEVAALQTDYTRTGWERDGLEIDLARVEAQVKAVETERSAVGHYLGLAWNHPLLGMKVRGWVMLLFGGVVAGVTLWKRAMDPDRDRAA